LLVLLFLEVSLLGTFGVDRFYLGQHSFALLKFVGAIALWCAASVLGCVVTPACAPCGLRVMGNKWSAVLFENMLLPAALALLLDLADYGAIMYACLRGDSRIEYFGYRASFPDGAAVVFYCRWAAVVHICLLSGIVAQLWRGSGASTSQASVRDGAPTKRGSVLFRVLRGFTRTDMVPCDASPFPEPCAICLEPIVGGQCAETLPCFHVFHHACASQHFKRNAVDPSSSSSGAAEPRSRVSGHNSTAQCPLCRCLACSSNEVFDLED
jgi:hypothetical protein